MIPGGPGIPVEHGGPLHRIPHSCTARTAFIGRTLRGPVDRVVPVGSFAEFQQVFGGLWQPSALGYAIEQFFDNGGRDALVVRVVNGARPATLSLAAGNATLRMAAVRPGTREFLRASVDYDNVAPNDDDEFNLTIQRVRSAGTAHVEDQEIFLRASVLPTAERFIGKLLSGSSLVDLKGATPPMRPDRTLDAASGLATRYVPSNADGDDGAPLTDYDLIGSRIDSTGVFALEAVESFNFLCLPPLSREQDVGSTALLVAARYCTERRALLIVDPPATWQSADDALEAMRNWDVMSADAVMYFPRILAHDKLRGRFESFAPCGAVAGMLARQDDTTPLWGTARIEHAALRPGFRPSCLVPEEKRVRLARLGVNVIQASRCAGRIGMEPRTLAGGTASDAQWQTLSARRLALFILNSIVRGTRWVVLDGSRDVVAVISAQVLSFFTELHRAGGLGDRAAEESFFVLCDDRVNPRRETAGGSRLAGAFNVLIGFPASRRGEFHSFKIAHMRHGTTVTSVSLNRLNDPHFNPEEHEWALVEPLDA